MKCQRCKSKDIGRPFSTVNSRWSPKSYKCFRCGYVGKIPEDPLDDNIFMKGSVGSCCVPLDYKIVRKFGKDIS